MLFLKAPRVLKRVELRPRGASFEPNHRFYGPDNGAVGSSVRKLLAIDSHIRL